MILRFLGLALLAAAPAAMAQNLLVVQEGNSTAVVRAIGANGPMIEIDGKLRNASGSTYGFRKAKAYRKGMITITNFAVTISHTDNLGVDYGYGLDAVGHLESSVSLQRCFIVLEITSGKDKGVFYNELPDLPAGEIRELRIVARLRDQVEAGTYQIHIFSDGLELLNSKMPASYLMQESRRTDALILQNTPDHTVALNREKAVVAPVYPAALVAQGLAGSAQVRCTINVRGEVVSAEVAQATQPLFGEAAVAAVRQWKFEPAVKDHHYVEATVIVPVNFAPPPGGGANKAAQP